MAAVGMAQSRSPRDWECKVVTTAPSRARQMNSAVEGCQSEYLIFLHADTLLPRQFQRCVRETLAGEKVVAGAFRLRIDGEQSLLRVIEAGANRRSRYLQMPYGDQALFLRTELFREVGGYPDLPIMEDFELIRRLRRRGRIALAHSAVLTSGRRWKELGIIRTTLVNQTVVLGLSGRNSAHPNRLLVPSRTGSGSASTRLFRSSLRVSPLRFPFLRPRRAGPVSVRRRTWRHPR